jgi:hypothetical protein
LPLGQGIRRRPCGGRQHLAVGRKRETAAQELLDRALLHVQRLALEQYFGRLNVQIVRKVERMPTTVTSMLDGSGRMSI